GRMKGFEPPSCDEVAWRRAVWDAARTPDRAVREAVRELVEAIDQSGVTLLRHEAFDPLRAARAQVERALGDDLPVKDAAQKLLNSLMFCEGGPSLARASRALRVALGVCEDPADQPPSRSAAEVHLKPGQVTPEEKDWVLALVKHLSRDRW